MNGSPYSAAVFAAIERATQLGHRLGKWYLTGSLAESTCVTCGDHASVRCYAPVTSSGNALDMACKSGEENVPPAPAATPPSGAAKKPPQLKTVRPVGTLADMPLPVLR